MRERPADIVPLSETFLQEIGRSFGRPAAGLTREARQALIQYQWPGNVRELRNVLERATILSEGALIGAEHLALPPAAARSSRNDTTDLGALEHSTIATVLQECRETRRKPRGGLGCHARSSTSGSAGTDSRNLLPRDRESGFSEIHHAPVESNEADHARAVGTLSPRPRSNADDEVQHGAARALERACTRTASVLTRRVA